MATDTLYLEVEARARQSLGISDQAIYRKIAQILSIQAIGGGTIADVGCGVGNLRRFVAPRFTRYIGVDVVRYEAFPPDAEFSQVDLDTGRSLLPDACADAVISVETIEHLENPRAFMRELTRLAKPGGWVIVTTPNQLSLLSLLTLLFKKRYTAFQDVNYPAHITALLEIDLVRIARECGLTSIEIDYSGRGRLVLTPWHYPKWLSESHSRLFSDNLLMIGRKSDH